MGIIKKTKADINVWSSALARGEQIFLEYVSLNLFSSTVYRVAGPLVFLSKEFFLNCIALNFLNPKIPKNIKNDKKILKFHVYKREYKT